MFPALIVMCPSLMIYNVYQGSDYQLESLFFHGNVCLGYQDLIRSHTFHNL